MVTLSRPMRGAVGGPRSSVAPCRRLSAGEFRLAGGSGSWNRSRKETWGHAPHPGGRQQGPSPASIGARRRWDPIEILTEESRISWPIASSAEAGGGGSAKGPFLLFLLGRRVRGVQRRATLGARAPASCSCRFGRSARSRDRGSSRCSNVWAQKESASPHSGVRAQRSMGARAVPWPGRRGAAAPALSADARIREGVQWTDSLTPCAGHA